MIMSRWQDKTRGGYPVENVRPIDLGTWKWAGEVTYPDGIKPTLTWTEDGYHGSYKQPRDSDLLPLETPPEAPAEPDARKALAMAAKAYKRACDATEAAEEAEQRAHDALAVAFEAYGVPTVVVNIDGAAILFEHDGGVGYAEIEVL